MSSWLIENGNLEAVQRSKVRDGKHEYRKVICECSKKEIQESSCKSFALFIVKLYL